jgi:hypothetical protein
MNDADKWVIPEPPVREVSTCTIQSIRLKKLPPDVNLAAQRAKKEISDEEYEVPCQHCTTMRILSYTHCTQTQSLSHRLHVVPAKRARMKSISEGSRYQKNIWTVDRLKDHTPEDLDDDVMIINAAGKGAEVLAKAWCSERGKNADIRRASGPCFVRGVRAAGV